MRQPKPTALEAAVMEAARELSIATGGRPPTFAAVAKAVGRRRREVRLACARLAAMRDLPESQRPVDGPAGRAKPKPVGPKLVEPKLVEPKLPASPSDLPKPLRSHPVTLLALAAQRAGRDRDSMAKLWDAVQGMLINWYDQLFAGTRRAIARDDYLQVAYLGLDDAVESFDPAKGCKFSTHLLWRVRAFVSRYVEDSGLIRIPAYLHGESKVRRNAECVAAAERARGIASLSCDGADWMMDTRADAIGAADEAADAEAQASRSALITRHAWNLPDRERRVIAGRYGLFGAEPLTLEQLSVRLGMTRQGVAYIQERAERRLASAIREECRRTGKVITIDGEPIA